MGDFYDDDLYGESVSPQSIKQSMVSQEKQIEIPVGQVEFIHDVPLNMIAKIGSVQKSIGEVLALKPNMVIEFNKVVGEPMDVFIGGRLMCRGEIVVVNERYGIRISEVVRADDSQKDQIDE